ncbi:hypothetical protein TRV_05666, partial [Trichophyton verrucosum HKI 0517]
TGRGSACLTYQPHLSHRPLLPPFFSLFFSFHPPLPPPPPPPPSKQAILSPFTPSSLLLLLHNPSMQQCSKTEQRAQAVCSSFSGSSNLE